MLGGSDDAASLGLVLDAVHAGDEAERLLRFGDVARVEEVSTRVCEAAASPPHSLADERIVAAVVVAENGADGVAEDVDGDVAAAGEIEAIPGEALPDKGPDEGLRGLLGHLKGRLVGVDEEVLPDHLEQR